MIEEKSTPQNSSATPSVQLHPGYATLPVVPIREGVLFPSTESILTFGRKLSVAAIRAARHNNNMVVLLTQKESTNEIPGAGDLYEIGTLAAVERTLNADGQVNALVRGIGRVRVVRYTGFTPHITAVIKKLEDVYENTDEIKALASHLQKEFRKAVHMGKPVEFLNFMKLMSGVTDGELVDQIASTLSLSTDEKQHILNTVEVKKRLSLVIDLLSKEMKVLEIEKDVATKTQQKFDKSMRESVLRERLKTIQKELGEIDDEEEVLNEYQTKLKKMKFTPEVKEKVEREIKRLRQMSVNNPEAGYIRSWLDIVFELPWNERSKVSLDLKRAEKILNKNHYGLKEVKDRVLEYMSVLQLKQRKTEDQVTSPTILCFVGPPGVGKTSIGRSIAEATGRKFTKLSLGGVRDEAEIRGHRRTYVGSMPGRILANMKQVKSKNPVFILDEIDKVGADFRGDPSAALLEVLDPEQNKDFEDHYLDMPFDLSEVLFITTANTLDTIPPALKDRLEIVRYAGYTQEEKFFIADQYLVKKVMATNGLDDSIIRFSDSAVKTIINRYTREAGVRDLERQLGKIARKVARQVAESTTTPHPRLTITNKNIKSYLGPEKFDVTLAEKEDLIGLATGLAWTSVGGEVLFIEVALTPGKGSIQLTGKLGDVMKESAQAALTYVKANADKLGISATALDSTDVHIHVPEGAVPKDGPSAGITITTAIVSAFTKRPVKREIAMTGEVTLRGRVLRIGGLKEKSIAAHQAGSKMVLIPKDNERDLEDIPESVKKGVVFKPVSRVEEVLKLALE